MPNTPPVVVPVVNKEEFMLPDNILTWDLSGSFDFDKDGNQVKRDFIYEIYLNGNKISTSVSGFISLAEGSHELNFKVIDKRGASSTAVVPVLVKNIVTKFGGKIQGDGQQQIKILKDLGVEYGRPASIAVSTFDGKSNRLDEFFAAGIKCVVNINNANSNQTLPFPTDLVTYEKQLRKVLDVYASKISVAVIENEPTNQNYYNGTMAQYLAELAVAVRVCHEYGVLVADGCVHAENVIQIINNDPRPSKGVPLVKELLAGYKNIPLDFVNVHTRSINNTYPENQIVETVNYIRSYTGHDVISNEWHTEGAKVALGRSTVLDNICKQWKEAKVKISMIWSGDGGTGQSEADPVGLNGVLTEF